MSEFTGEERRRYVRVGAELAARLNFGDSVIPAYAVLTRDISTEGLGIEIDGGWPESYERLANWRELVEVEFDLPSGETYRLSAVVVWGQSLGAGVSQRFKLGLRFLDVGEHDRKALARFIKARRIEEGAAREAMPAREAGDATLEEKLEATESRRSAAEKQARPLSERLKALEGELRKRDAEMARLRARTEDALKKAADAERLHDEALKATSRLEAVEEEYKRTKTDILFKEQLIGQFQEREKEHEKLAERHRELARELDELKRRKDSGADRACRGG
jgi:hypothetical protein